MKPQNEHDWSLCPDTAEVSVLGMLLIQPEALESLIGVIDRFDFYRLDHQEIFATIVDLAEAGKPRDLKSIVESFQKREDAGDEYVASHYLLNIARNTATASTILEYAKVVAEKARLRRLRDVATEIEDRIRGGADAAQITESLLETLTEEKKKSPANVAAIVLRHVADIVAELREPMWLEGLHKILEQGVLAVLAGPRSTFKSFVALFWVMLAALNGHSVVILSAEGGGLDRRIAAFMKIHAPSIDLRTLRIVALERALNLNFAETFEALDAAIAAVGFTPDIVLIDTFSKYAPGLDENDNAAVALFLSTLSAKLRHQYNCTVLLVAHSGHSDARRPRGASTLMANPDAEYIVERPDPLGMTVTVTRERFKDAPALAPLAYTAEVVDLARLDSHGDPVTSLVMRDTDPSAVPIAASARKSEPSGAKQRQLLAALRARKAEGGLDIWTIGDIREVGRLAGMHKNSARAAAEALTFSPYMVAAVGGWRLKDE